MIIERGFVHSLLDVAENRCVIKEADIVRAFLEFVGRERDIRIGENYGGRADSGGVGMGRGRGWLVEPINLD